MSLLEKQFYLYARRIDWGFTYSIIRAARHFVLLPPLGKIAARKYLDEITPVEEREKWAGFEHQANEELNRALLEASKKPKAAPVLFTLNNEIKAATSFLPLNLDQPSFTQGGRALRLDY